MDTSCTSYGTRALGLGRPKERGLPYVGRRRCWQGWRRAQSTGLGRVYRARSRGARDTQSYRRGVVDADEGDARPEDCMGGAVRAVRAVVGTRERAARARKGGTGVSVCWREKKYSTRVQVRWWEASAVHEGNTSQHDGFTESSARHTPVWLHDVPMAMMIRKMSVNRPHMPRHRILLWRWHHLQERGGRVGRSWGV